MYIVILFFFFYCQASNNDVNTVIIHMPGTCDGGFDFLNPPSQNFNIEKRFSTDMNNDKVIKYCSSTSTGQKISCIYTNNLAINKMDLGGPSCVKFFKEMILHAHTTYPHADLILVGGSQGSVGPFGALAELIREQNTEILSKIQAVAVEAVLGSAHETINFHAQKIPILKILPCISKKIAPLLAEYMPRFFPGFAQYDAFAPQLYHYIETINTSDHVNHIKFLMLHDTNDEIIPCLCAQKANNLLRKESYYIQTEVKAEKYFFNETELKKYKIPFVHLPSNADENQKIIIDFLKNPQSLDNRNPATNIIKKIPENKTTVDQFFVSKSSFEKFCIRRVRDAITISTLFIMFKSISYVCKKIICNLKTLYSFKKF